MKHKFKLNDVVCVRFPSSNGVEGRTISEMRVIEQLKIKDKPFYKLDWTSTGRSHLLNTVSISENVLYAVS